MISCAIAKVPLRFVLKDTLIMLVPILVVLAACIIPILRCSCHDRFHPNI